MNRFAILDLGFWILQSKIENRLPKAGPPLAEKSKITGCAGQARLQRFAQSAAADGQASPKASHCGGQALVEFIVALVAIIAVVLGTIVLNKIEWNHSRAMTNARAEAGELALNLVYQGALDARFIADWETGADAIRYTADDEAVVDGTALTLIGNIAANAELEGDYPIPSNSISRLAAAPTPMTEFYLVKGSDAIAVDVSSIPAFGRLISGEPSISVESQAWLVWTGGIY